MTDVIILSDLSAELQANDNIDLMLAGANGQARRVAPCLDSADPAPSADQLSEAKLTLLGAIQRWVQNGSGAIQQQNAGPFGLTVDTRQRGGYKLWPSEIEQLQDICGGAASSGAFSIDTAPGLDNGHLPWCDVMFGSTSCSCGYDIAGRPIYENAPGL